MRFTQRIRAAVQTIAVVLSLALPLMLAVSAADARVGGGFSSGSRGSRTFSVPPSTSTAPGSAQPFNRTFSQPGDRRRGCPHHLSGSDPHRDPGRDGYESGWDGRRGLRRGEVRPRRLHGRCQAASGQSSPRDNVVFEAGLFGGVLGMRRTFILHAAGAKLPSDLLGLTLVRYGGALTPTETKVAALVGEGLSNPEIAAKLLLSRRTVATHVSHILRKLGVNSRIDIAREAALRTMTPK